MSPDTINDVSVAATFFMALATLALAFYTARLARDTAAGIAQAERHHTDLLRPYCIGAFTGASDSDPIALAVGQMPAGKGVSGHFIAVSGSITNTGSGLAKNLVFYLNKRMGAGNHEVYRLTRPAVLRSVLGPNTKTEFQVILDIRDVMKIMTKEGWESTQPEITFVAQDATELVLEYCDVFDNVYRTVHPRGRLSNPARDAQMMNDRHWQEAASIEPDRPLPIFLKGRQSVLTLSDMPRIPSEPG